MDNITKKKMETELTRDLRDLYVTELGILEKMIEVGYLSADDGDHIRHLHRPTKRIAAFIRLLLQGQGYEDSLRFLIRCLEETKHDFLVESLKKTLLKYLPESGWTVLDSTVTVQNHQNWLVKKETTISSIQETHTDTICVSHDMFPPAWTDAYSESSDPETNTDIDSSDIATALEETRDNELDIFDTDLERHVDQLIVKGHIDEDDSESFLKKSKRKVAIFLKHKLFISNLPPSEFSAHNKWLDLIYDKINEDLNTGSALVKLEDKNNPNIRFIHFYFSCCENLYNNNMLQAKTYVKLAKRLLNFTTFKDRFRSDLCTLETWLYLRTGKLSKMEEVLDTYGAIVYASNCSELTKSKGWFHFDYARFYEQWMERVVEPFYINGLRTEGIKHARKAVDAFAASDSSDGKIGQGFSLCLIAKLSLFCGHMFTMTKLDVDDDDINRAKQALKRVGLMFDIVPEILRVDVFLCHCDLQFRLGNTKEALEYALRTKALATKLDLQHSLTEACSRIDALTLTNESVNQSNTDT